MDTSIATDTLIVGTHEGTGQARKWYLSNGADTGILLSVPMGTHWHPYLSLWGDPNRQDYFIMLESLMT